MNSVPPFVVYALDHSFGFSAYHAYLRDLDAVKHGATLKDLGYSDRRVNSTPIILQDGIDAVRITSPFSLRESNFSPGSVAVVPLNGVMTSDGGPCAYGTADISQWMYALYDNPKVSAIVMDMNTGGGEAIAAQMLRSAVMMRNKPVVSWVHASLSGGYMVASATDEIWSAGPISMLGSIGAMIVLDKKELADLSESSVIIVGRDSPNKNKDIVDAIGGDFSAFEEMVSNLTVEFHNMVKSDRRLTGSPAEIKDTLSGKIFQTADAKRRGLVDGTGSFSKVLLRAKNLAKQNSSK